MLKLEIGKTYEREDGKREKVQGHPFPDAGPLTSSPRGAPRFDWYWTLQGNWYREDGRAIGSRDGALLPYEIPTWRDLVREVAS